VSTGWTGRGWFDPPSPEGGSAGRSSGRASDAEPAAPPDPVEAAHAAALRLLTVRAHSRAEVEQRLRRRGFDPEPVAQALDRLERAGLLDDAAFAAELAASRTRRGYAANVVQRDLRTRGVDRDVADRAAAAASPPDAEAERCHTLAADWLERHAGLEAPVAARRLAGFLARRGYPPSLVADAVRQALGRDQSGAPD
jgi:regulatory protein